MVLQHGQRCRLGFKGSGLQKPCLHQTPIEDDAPLGALGYCPHLEEHSYPHAGPIKIAGSPRIYPGSPVTLGARGRGSTRKPLLLHHRIKDSGARVGVQSKQRTQGIISLWRFVHSEMQSDRLREAPR